MNAAVLCVHSFSSSARQYAGLAARLSASFRVIAADLYGHGQRPPWTGERFTLADEAAPLEAMLPEGAPLHLVGHSYGGAVALRIAANHRERVRSMTLYEPAIWGTLAELCAGEPAAQEIEAVRDDTLRMLEQGAAEAAAERFVDYWTGAGSWAATPPERRPRLSATVRSLREGWQASFLERWSAEARRALRLLRETLPRAQVREFGGLGHLGPITHPERIDEAVEAFIFERSLPCVHSQLSTA